MHSNKIFKETCHALDLVKALDADAELILFMRAVFFLIPWAPFCRFSPAVSLQALKYRAKRSRLQYMHLVLTSTEKSRVTLAEEPSVGNCSNTPVLF